MMEFVKIKKICLSAIKTKNINQLNLDLSELKFLFNFDENRKEQNYYYNNNFKFLKVLDYYSDALFLIRCTDINEIIEGIEFSKSDIKTYIENIIYDDSNINNINDYFKVFFNNNLDSIKLDLVAGYCCENILEEISSIEKGEGES